jgi:hypothetical protein
MNKARGSKPSTPRPNKWASANKALLEITPEKAQAMKNDDLLSAFVNFAIAQADGELDLVNVAVLNRLYKPWRAVCDEFRRRGPDVRRLLIPLMEFKSPGKGRVDSPAYQVRLNAARELLAVVPDQARATLKAISKGTTYPQGLQAGMCLYYVDKGISKPT